jgi:signal transduction histidine kinase
MKKPSSYKIIIVADNEAACDHYISLLTRHHGYTFAIQVSSKLKEVYRLLPEYQPDCVLMDKEMAEEDTLLFLKELKHSKSFRRYPVILLTEANDANTNARALKAGVQNVLSKKELSSWLLISSVVEVIKTNRLIDKLKQQRKVLLEKNKELNEYKKYLEMRVMSRTAELKESYEQLVEEMTLRKRIEEQLTSRNKELDTFVYKASHDLKGPLASLIGVTNIARLDLTEPLAGRYLEMINDSAQKLNFILANLLEVTKIKYINIEVKPVHFSELVKQVIAEFTRVLQSEEIHMDTQINQKQVFVSDPYLISTILHHLIDNAIHYRKEYTYTRISVEINEVSEGIEIMVKDNGQGIDKEVQSRVFDMFYRHNLQSKGSGLGLYICKNCVEKLGGNLQLISEPGQGTEVKVELPQLKNEQK